MYATTLVLETWIACPRTRFKLWKQIIETANVRGIKAYVNAVGFWVFEWKKPAEFAPGRTTVAAIMARAAELIGQPAHAIQYTWK